MCSQKFFAGIVPLIALLIYFILHHSSFTTRHVSFLEYDIIPNDLAANQELYGSIITCCVRRRHWFEGIAIFCVSTLVFISFWQVIDRGSMDWMYLWPSIASIVFWMGSMISLAYSLWQEFEDTKENFMHIISSKQQCTKRINGLRNIAWIILLYEIFDFRLQGIDMTIGFSARIETFVCIILTILVMLFYQMILNEKRFQRRLLLQDSIPKELTASIWSYFSFSWFDDTIGLGNEKPLFVEDLDQLIPKDRAEYICKTFEKHLKLERGLLWNLITYNWTIIMLQTLATFISAVLSFTGPYFLREILAYVETANSKSDPYNALGYALILFLISNIRSISDGQTYFLGRRIGLRVRAVLIHLIYQKSLSKIAKYDGQTNADAGKIVNLMAVDATKILDVSCYFMYLWSTPLQSLVCISFLIHIAGWAGLAGLAVMLCMIPMSGVIGILVSKYQKDLMKKTDARISAISEV